MDQQQPKVVNLSSESARFFLNAFSATAEKRNINGDLLSFNIIDNNNNDKTAPPPPPKQQQQHHHDISQCTNEKLKMLYTYMEENPFVSLEMICIWIKKNNIMCQTCRETRHSNLVKHL